MDEGNAESRQAGWRLFGTTKGKVLALLCRGRQTVTELAAQLGLTDNAIRAQLEKLIRDGFARQAGSRRGVRKPHADYELTTKARNLFPKAYEPVLRTLADVLAERLPPEAGRGVVDEVARRLLREHVGELQPSNARRRLEEIVKRLGELAAGVELSEEGGATVVRSCGCPLASVTARHPEVCGLLAEVAGDILGAPVREHCQKGEAPQCRFEIAPAQRELVKQTQKARRDKKRLP